MQDHQKLQEENERLKTELEEYKEIKNSLGFWGKLFLNITAPSILKGFGFALICFVIIYYSVTVDNFIPIIIGGLILVLSLFIGAWYAEIRFQKKLIEIKDKAQDSLNNSKVIIPQLLKKYLITRFSSDNKKEESLSELKETIDKFINEYTPLIETGFHLVKSFFLRFWAFSTLMAILLAVIGFGTFVSTYLQVQRLDFQNELISAQNKRLDQQVQLQEAERRSTLVYLFANIMDEISNELIIKENKLERQLSPQLIGRIIALSTRLKPYKYLHFSDTCLIKKELSPERGQLLSSLIRSQLSFLSYFSIFEKADFTFADLELMDLKNLDFGGANLEHANLKNSNLFKSTLSGAYLHNSNLENANLRQATLDGTYLCFANLKNSILIKTKLRGANLTGTKLDNAQVDSLNFITKLEQLGVIGIDEIKKRYYVNPTPQYQPSDRNKKRPYFLIKIKE